MPLRNIQQFERGNKTNLQKAYEQHLKEKALSKLEKEANKNGRTCF